MSAATSTLWTEFFALQSSYARTQSHLALAKQQNKEHQQRLELLQQQKRDVQERIQGKLRELRVLQGAEDDISSPEDAEQINTLKAQLERLKRYYESLCLIDQQRDKSMNEIEAKVRDSWVRMRENVRESAMNSTNETNEVMEDSAAPASTPPQQSGVITSQYRSNCQFLEQQGVEVESLTVQDLNTYCNEMTGLIDSLKVSIEKGICAGCMQEGN